jgi:hypothetical protein
MYKLFIINYLGIILLGCQDKSFVYQGAKMKGISFVAPARKVDSTAFQPIKDVNAEWISLMPYGFIKEDEANFFYGNGHQWWGESSEGTAACVLMAHQKGLKVMIKPHTWVGRGGYTGDFELKNEADWQNFEKQYTKYVLEFAKVADSTHAEIYCIATEFKKFVEKRPTFWKNLILEVKKVYKGKLTYAENWDCYDDVPFWNELDYVGIDGYFPLTEERNPSLETIKKGWKKHIDEISNFAEKVQKPILFTEFGYQNTDFTTQKPWETMNHFPENDALQADAFRAVLSEVWQQKWFAGGFVWKWFPIFERPKNETNVNKFEGHHDKYSPQGKLAETVLRDFYAK